MDGSFGEVPLRLLGSTGVKVSAIGLGGHHIGRPEVAEDEAIRIVRTAYRERHHVFSWTTAGTITRAGANSGWAGPCAAGTGTRPS